MSYMYALESDSLPVIENACSLNFVVVDLHLVGLIGRLGLGAGGHLGEAAELALVLSKRGCRYARSS